MFDARFGLGVSNADLLRTSARMMHTAGSVCGPSFVHGLLQRVEHCTRRRIGKGHSGELAAPRPGRHWGGQWHHHLEHDAANPEIAGRADWIGQRLGRFTKIGCLVSGSGEKPINQSRHHRSRADQGRRTPPSKPLVAADDRINRSELGDRSRNPRLAPQNGFWLCARAGSIRASGQRSTTSENSRLIARSIGPVAARLFPDGNLAGW